MRNYQPGSSRFSITERRMLGPNDLSGPAIRWEDSADSFTQAGYVVREDHEQIRIDCSRCDAFNLLQRGLVERLIGNFQSADVALVTYPFDEECTSEVADQYSFKAIRQEALLGIVREHRTILFETGHISMSIAGRDGGSVILPTHGTVVVNYPDDPEAVGDLQCFLAFHGFFPKPSSVSGTYRDLAHTHRMRTDFGFRLNRLIQDLED